MGSQLRHPVSAMERDTTPRPIMPQKHEREKLRQTNVRLSPLGNRLLDSLTKYHGVTKTAVIDMLLRDHARLLGVLAPPRAVAELEIVDASDKEDGAGQDEPE